MTMGQIIYYIGIGLAGSTVLIAILFLIFKPKYMPESTAYLGIESDATQKLRNGYPTDKLTRRHGKSSGRIKPEDPTELIGTALMANRSETLSIEEDKPKETEKF